MVSLKELQKIMVCFPCSFLNQKLELIVHERANVYFMVGNCEDEFDMKCKVLEWFSRDASCSMPYKTEQANRRLHLFILDGINRYLGTQFTFREMELIYSRLGNACNHPLTVKFVESGYDLELLRRS